MSLISRIASALSAVGINVEQFFKDAVDSFKATPQDLPALKAHLAVPQMEVVRRTRSRVPHSNREARLKAGLPHGTSGAKLVRRAAAACLTLRGQDVALYAA